MKHPLRLRMQIRRAQPVGPASSCHAPRPLKRAALRPSILLVAGILSASGVCEATAEDRSRSLPGGRTLNLYGQFSPTSLSVDDGVSSYFSVRDDSHATSRFGVDLSRELGARTIRWTLESGFALPTTAGTSQGSVNDRWAFGDATIRKAELRLSGPLGEWSLGQGSTATDGVASQDLSATGVVASSSISDDAGSFQLRSAKTGELTDIRLGDVFANFDGNRRVRVRYDSPRRGGYTVAMSAGLDDFYEGAETFADAAIRYEHDAGTVQIRGAAGASWQREGDEDDEIAWLGSVSAYHPDSGVSTTAAAGFQNEGGRYLYVKAGYRMSPFRIGDTVGAADVFLGRDFETEGARSRSIGLQLVQSWDSRNMRAYLGYRRYAYDDTTPETYHEARSILAGLSWQF